MLKPGTRLNQLLCYLSYPEFLLSVIVSFTAASRGAGTRGQQEARATTTLIEGAMPPATRVQCYRMPCLHFCPV